MLPQITPEQRAKALEAATRTRKARAQAKTDLAKGKVTLAEVLGDPESPLQGARVLEILKTLPGVGPVKAASVIERLGIADGRRIQGLGQKQRAALEAEFATADA